jgi:hypothetical protein
MKSDIKLDNNHLHLEGDFIHCASMDFILDNPQRNKGMGGPLRRALVHDFNDGLTLNWAGDYPGGVTIFGKTINLPGLDKNKIPETNVGIAQAEKKGDFIHRKMEQQFLPIKIKMEPEISTIFDDIESPVNLIKEIQRLRNIVLSLDRRVKELEKGR